VIRYRAGDEEKPDEGSIVIAAPADNKPQQKIESLGLRPADRNLQNRPGVDQLRQNGGALTYVDVDGQFKLELENPGSYYLFVISRNTGRPADKKLWPDDQAILSSYFADPDNLIGDREILVQSPEVAGAQTKRLPDFTW
jgi:hypothetical protein